ncbi:MAG: NYN domain-containing protein [Candidatus Omnitrophota bacterium]
MLVYIIDGFNLVHRIPAVKKSSQPRLDLIRYIKIKKLTGSSNNKVIIVFDGGFDSIAGQEAGYEIVFSGSRSADEVIMSRVEKMKNKSEIIVVTDDREIRDSIKSQGAKICRTADFINNKLKKIKEEDKDISYTLQNEITKEMRKIWLKE